MNNSGNEPEEAGATGQPDFARELTLFDIVFIGVGAMIGGSIFVLTGLAAGVAGPALVLAFALNGFITIFTGMVYAELGSAFPEPGGGYLWVREALGRSQAFLSGWMSWFAHAVAGSLYILSFGSFLSLVLSRYVFPAGFGIPPEIVQKVSAVVAAAIFTAINYRGAKETSRAENAVTTIQLLIIAVFVMAGLLAMTRRPNVSASFQPFFPNGAGGVFLAMGLTFIAFEGYEIIVQSGREVQNPRESIPKAVFYSMAVVVTLYVLVAIVLLGAVRLTPSLLHVARSTNSIGGSTVSSLPSSPTLWQVYGHLGEFGLAQAVGQLLPYGTLIILVVGILSSLAALNATTFSSSRVGYAMGHDRVFPDIFRHIHPKYRTPHISVLLSGALIAIMAVTLPLAQVAAATDLMFLLLFLQVNYSMIRLRRRYGDQLKYGYIVPFFPYVPIIGIISKFFLAVYFFNYSPLAWGIAAGWVLLGIVVFFGYSRGRIRATEIESKIQTYHEVRAKREREYQVLVPIANPETAPVLIALGSALARRNDGELLLTSVVTVPRQTPLREGAQFSHQANQLLTDAVRYVPDDVPVHRSVTIGRNVGRSIVNVANQHNSDLILLGWRGRRRRAAGYSLGSTIDIAVEDSECDVVVTNARGSPGIGGEQSLRTTGDTLSKKRSTSRTPEPQKILVPITSSTHAAFAVEVASAIASSDTRVILFHVATDTRDREPIRQILDTQRDQLVDAGIDADTVLTESSDVAEAVVEYAESQAVDTIVVGATREGIVPRALFGDVPETIGEDFNGTTLLVERHQPIRSVVERWLRRWFGRQNREDERPSIFETHEPDQTDEQSTR